MGLQYVSELAVAGSLTSGSAEGTIDTGYCTSTLHLDYRDALVSGANFTCITGRGVKMTVPKTKLFHQRTHSKI